MDRSPNKKHIEKKINNKREVNVVADNNISKYTPNSSRTFQTFSNVDKIDNSRKLSPIYINEKEMSDVNENIILLKQKYKKFSKPKNISKGDLRKVSSSYGYYKVDKYLIKDNSSSLIFGKDAKIKNNIDSKLRNDILIEKDKEIHKLKEKNKDLKTLIIKLKDTLDKINIILPNLLERHGIEEEEFEKLKIILGNENFKKEEKLKKIIKSESELKDRIEEKEKEITYYKAQNNLLQNQIKKLNSNIEKLEKININTVDELNKKNKLLENKILESNKNSKNNKEQEQKEINELINKNKIYIGQIDELNKKIKNLENEKNNFELITKEINEEKNKFKINDKEKEEKIEQLKKLNEDIKKNLENEKNDNKKNKEENINLKEENQI